MVDPFPPQARKKNTTTDMAQNIVCHSFPKGWGFLGRTIQPGPNLFVHIIQEGYTTWDEVRGHVGIPCLHQLPDVEEPIHIMWWILICVFEPCDYLLKPHTDHVLIESEGGSSPNSNIVLLPPILPTPVSFAASHHKPNTQPLDELML